jgi:hypothetical protein
VLIDHRIRRSCWSEFTVPKANPGSDHGVHGREWSREARTCSRRQPKEVDHEQYCYEK